MQIVTSCLHLRSDNDLRYADKYLCAFWKLDSERRLTHLRDQPSSLVS